MRESSSFFRIYLRDIQGYNYHMSLKDDKDGLSSSSRRFDRADGGKKEELKKQIKEKVGMEKQTDMQKVDLKSDMNLQMLKSEIAGKQDEETKRKTQAEEKAKERSTAPKTQSLKEREDAAMETAHEKVSSDELIQREQSQKEVADEEATAEPG